MRINFVLFLCLAITMASSANVKITRRRAVTTAGRGTTKAPTIKSAYAYLRTVRGKASCAEGSCPFWERHGRSFTALRCYSQQYQECTCLHRMCFSSCMFNREVCNNEMASCLRQICPRCMPASASAMCAVYDSMADQVATALSVFACYPCCPNLNGASNSNSNGTAGATTTTPLETSTLDPFAPTDDPFANDPNATEYPENNYYPGNENTPSTDDFAGQNQNGGIYPSNNGNNAGLNNGNNNGYFNGNDNTFPNENNNGYFNENGNGYSNTNGNGNSNTNGNGYSNTNGNGYSNTNGNGYSNTNGNGYSNTNGNGYSNTNGNGYPNTNGNANTNTNGYSNGNTNTNTNGNANTNGNGYPNANTNGASNANGNGYPNANTNGASNANGNGASNGNNNGASNGNNNGASNGNGNAGGYGGVIIGNCNIGNGFAGAVFPGSDAVFYNNNFPNRNQQVIRQRARQTVRTTKRIPATTRRTPVTTRRMVQALATVRGNNIKSGVRSVVSTQKNITIKSSN